MKGGSIVRTSRLRAGITQRELAERLNTTQSAIARLEGGAVSPTVETLSRVAQACGLELQIAVASSDDHDLGLAFHNQRLSYEARLDQFVAGIGFAQELRDAGRRTS